MKQLPSYYEYKVNGVTYKVTSIFCGKQSLKNLYENFAINRKKGGANCGDLLYNKEDNKTHHLLCSGR